MFTRDQQLENFRTERYTVLNNLRWELFLKMGLPLTGKTVFEPGAGIGDQTGWLLEQGVKHIHVNDGRAENLQFIQDRFKNDPRLSFVLGNIEECLDWPEFKFTVDLVFCWGVYYHINDPISDFRVMRQLSAIGPTIAFDYLEGSDYTESYHYDSPSTSVSRLATRPKTETLVSGLKDVWGYVYLPKTQMDWFDSCVPNNPRRLCVASRVPLASETLILQ